MRIRTPNLTTDVTHVSWCLNLSAIRMYSLLYPSIIQCFHNAPRFRETLNLYFTLYTYIYSLMLKKKLRDYYSTTFFLTYTTTIPHKLKRISRSKAHVILYLSWYITVRELLSVCRAFALLAPRWVHWPVKLKRVCGRSHVYATRVCFVYGKRLWDVTFAVSRSLKFKFELAGYAFAIVNIWRGTLQEFIKLYYN